MNNNIHLNIRSIDPSYKFTQKCFIPLKLLKCSEFQIGDYITIRGRSKTLLCRVFLQVQPEICVAADETVFYQNYDDHSKGDLTAFYPDSFCLIQTSILQAISVRVVFVSVITDIQENTVREILSHFVIGEGVTVKCAGQNLANIFGIDSIIIISISGQSVGQLTNATQISITEVSTVSEIIQKQKLKNLELGGLSDIYEILNLSLLETIHRKTPKSLILNGPSGCGKSSLLKKFLCESNAYSILIDGITKPNINNDVCDAYCKTFVNSHQLWPKKGCVLAIDHIDRLVPINGESCEKISKIVYLIKEIVKLNVKLLMIATATNSENVHSAVLKFFDKEVVIGMPSLSKRKNIIEAVLRSHKLNKIDIDKIAQLTPGYVGADIVALCREALSCTKSPSGVIGDTDELSNKDFVTTEDLEKVISIIEPTALKLSKWNLKVKPIHWDDIGGMKKIKERLQLCIEWPLHHPEAFEKVGLPCPRGLLLFGPPGCCKTTLARGLATECNANFFAASPAQLYSPYVGESEKHIVELFQQARLCAPSIIFLDELDSLVGMRKLDSKTQGISEKVLSTLLNEMDGFSTRSTSNMAKDRKILEEEYFPPSEKIILEEQYSCNKVIVVAATNRPDLIDDALLRPGRFDVILYAPPPNVEERNSILETLTRGIPMQGVNISLLAEETELFSGADLKNLCDTAGIHALRENTTAEFLSEGNFLSALQEVHPSISKEQISMYEKLASKYGPVITTIQ